LVYLLPIRIEAVIIRSAVYAVDRNPFDMNRMTASGKPQADDCVRLFHFYVPCAQFIDLIKHDRVDFPRHTVLADFKAVQLAHGGFRRVRPELQKWFKTCKQSFLHPFPTSHNHVTYSVSDYREKRSHLKTGAPPRSIQIFQIREAARILIVSEKLIIYTRKQYRMVDR